MVLHVYKDLLTNGNQNIQPRNSYNFINTHYPETIQRKNDSNNQIELLNRD